MVVSGHGLIQERIIGSEEVIEFEVDGDHIQAVQMLRATLTISST